MTRKLGTTNRLHAFLTAAVLAACIVGWLDVARQATAACGRPGSGRIDVLLSKASRWGVIRVDEITFGGVGSPEPHTWIDFHFVDLHGVPNERATLWHWGADTDGGALNDQSLRLAVGSYYVVLLKTARNRLEPVSGARSVFAIENLASGELSPYDAVHFDRAHEFIAPQGTQAISDAQLHEVIDRFAMIEDEAQRQAQP